MTHQNTGKPYEQITKAIFEDILSEANIKTLKIEHDVTLKGKTTNHQIDVFWSFEIGGIKYQTIVQAKDWSKPVDKGELLKFKGVLDDLPHQPKGIFVTKTGYQSGTLEYAKSQGILLYELSEVNTLGLPPNQKTIQIDFHSYFPEVSFSQVVFDQDWFEQKSAEFGLDDSALQSVQVNKEPSEITLFDSMFQPYSDMATFLKGAFLLEFKEVSLTEKMLEMPKETYLKSEHDRIPFFKLKRIMATYKVTKLHQKFEFQREDFTAFILKNVSDGTVRVVDGIAP